MGVLGIDCVKHYCVQLDFEAGKIRFLDLNHIDDTALGKSFPLSFPENAGRPFLRNSSLVEGAGTNTLIDTGYDADGALNPKHFKREVCEGRLIAVGTAAAGGKSGFARLPNCVWHGRDAILDELEERRPTARMVKG
jgi:hypothetical protein